MLHCTRIVCTGPAGIHFAKRLKDEGYAASDITILESQKRFGGKSFTSFLSEQPNVRHEVRNYELFRYRISEQAVSFCAAVVVGVAGEIIDAHAERSAVIQCPVSHRLLKTLFCFPFEIGVMRLSRAFLVCPIAVIRCQASPVQPIHSYNIDRFLQLGTCYMHLGYEPVRDLLKEYDLGDSEVGLGQLYLEKEKNGQQRKVWELTGEGVYTRGDNLGQDFDDWLLSEADRVCASVR